MADRSVSGFPQRALALFFVEIATINR